MKPERNALNVSTTCAAILLSLLSGCASVSPVPPELQAVYQAEAASGQPGGAISVSEMLQRARLNNPTTDANKQPVADSLSLTFKPASSELSATLDTRIQSFFDQQPIQRGWQIRCSPDTGTDRFQAIQVATRRCREVSRILKARHLPVKARLDTQASPGSVLISHSES